MTQRSKTFGPYSPIRQAGDMYFISGQVGVDPESNTAQREVREQTHQCLKNLTAVLAQKELSINDVIKTVVFLRNMDDFATVNEVYISYFDEPRPARSCIEVSGLPRVAGDTELLVEIEAVACRKGEVS